MVIFLCLTEPTKNVSAQVTREFSDDESALLEESMKATSSYNRLWSSIMTSPHNDKSFKQFDSPQDHWSKRNLFAVFVLIPLIILLLSMTIWQVTNGVAVDSSFLSPILSLIPSWKLQFFQSQSDGSFDIDLLIDRILANDKFNELLSTSNSDTDKLMFFAKSKLEDMEKDFVTKNDVLLTKMNENEAHYEEFEELKRQMENLKNNLDQDDKTTIADLKQQVEDLISKHEQLSLKLKDCQQQNSADSVQIQAQLEEALSSKMITKAELKAKLEETQKDLYYGLESNVLEKVRNDPMIMEKITMLANANARAVGQEFSKEDVVSIVHEALTVYDADKTGLFDFALESAGGTIASVRCTETYDVTQVLI